MRRLFGVSKEESHTPKGKPSLDDASAKIDAQVQSLEEKIIKADNEIKQLVAKGSTNATAKQQALQVMKRKKMYEQQRDQLIGTQFNVDSLKIQQEQAEITALAVEAMQAGQATLKQQHEKININQVDEITDSMAELSDEMKAINEALAQNTSTEYDDDITEEYAKMEEEMAAMALAGSTGTSTDVSTPAVPAATSLPTASAPVPSRPDAVTG